MTKQEYDLSGPQGCKKSWEMWFPADQLISHTSKITCGALFLIKKKRKAWRDDSTGLSTCHDSVKTCVWIREDLYVYNPVLCGDRAVSGACWLPWFSEKFSQESKAKGDRAVILCFYLGTGVCTHTHKWTYTMHTYTIHSIHKTHTYKGEKANRYT